MDDCNRYTIKELRQILSDLNVPGRSKMVKGQMCEELIRRGYEFRKGAQIVGALEKPITRVPSDGRVPLQLTDLPDELLYRVMENLPVRDVRTLRGVSHETRRIAEDETYWKAKVQERLPFDGSYRQLYNKLDRLYVVTFISVNREDVIIRRNETIGVYSSKSQAVDSAFEVYLKNIWFLVDLEDTDYWIIDDRRADPSLGTPEISIINNDEFLTELGNSSIPGLIDLFIRYRSTDNDLLGQIRQFSQDPLGSKYLELLKRSFIGKMEQRDGEFSDYDEYEEITIRVSESKLG